MRNFLFFNMPEIVSKIKELTPPFQVEMLTVFLIREFSFLYVLFAKPKLISENFHLIDNVKLYSEENKQLFAEILNQSENLLNLDLQKLNVDKNLVNRVTNYASVKHIISKNLNNKNLIS